MYKIIIFTHGLLCQELVNTAEMIMGEQEELEAFSLAAGCDLDEIKERLLASIHAAYDQGLEVLVLTDLLFGTPFNISLSLQQTCRIQHITGTNLTMLIEALNRRGIEPLTEVIADILQTGREAIGNADDLIKQANA